MQHRRAVVLVLVVVSFVALAGAQLLAKPYEEEGLLEWKAFKQNYGKHYDTPEEEAKRFAIFKDNLVGLAKHKQSYSSMQAGVTKFYDLTLEEFRQLYLHHTLGPVRSSAVTQKGDLSYQKDFPETWDWVQKGAVTPVKNEQQCGATWAMAAIDVLESVCKIAGYPLVSFNTAGQDQGCNGGYPMGAYEYILQAGGVESDSNYPYKGQFQSSVDPKKFVSRRMKSYQNITIEASEQSLMQWVYSQSPVVVCVDVFQTAMYDYKVGVITGAECPGQQIDHCLALVGWDYVNGKRVWKLKNQWGTDWGMGGYVYYEIGTNTCGMDSSFSVVPCVNDVC